MVNFKEQQQELMKELTDVKTKQVDMEKRLNDIETKIDLIQTGVTP